MAGDTANPRVWVNADVYVAPVGTAGPTNTSTALIAAWLPVGLLSEDGMTEAREDDVDDKYAWGGILVRTTKSRHKRSFAVTVLEDNKVLRGILNPSGSSVTATGVTTRVVKVPGPDVRAWVIELKDGTIIKRIHIPRGEVVEVGERTFSDSELSMVELTINVLPASDGTLYNEITNDTQAVEP
jgi:hypothetical protein